MKELRPSSPFKLQKSVLTCWKAKFAFGLLSRIFTVLRTAGKGGGYLFIYFLPRPFASQTLIQ